MLLAMKKIRMKTIMNYLTRMAAIKMIDNISALKDTKKLDPFLLVEI